MTNNDVLRRLRFCFDFSDSKMMALFAQAGVEVTREEISAWLKKDEDPGFQPCEDVQLASFLNGLIVDRRGAKEGPRPVPEARLSNNIVFRKLKIALDLKADELLAILALGEHSISKHELSALFRKPDHKHYRACQDQILRKFLNGVQRKYRDADPSEEAWD